MERVIRIALLFALASAVLSCLDESHVSGSSEAHQQGVPLEREILGEWVAGEIYFAQPPIEVQQRIKRISFVADNNMVTWSCVSEGTMQQCKGRFTIFKSNAASSPTLVVTPEESENANLSRICHLKLTDLEIDYDARFPRESIGKVLKTKDSDGRALLFVRIKR